MQLPIVIIIDDDFDTELSLETTAKQFNKKNIVYKWDGIEQLSADTIASTTVKPPYNQKVNEIFECIGASELEQEEFGITPTPDLVTAEQINLLLFSLQKYMDAENVIATLMTIRTISEVNSKNLLSPERAWHKNL